MILKKIRKIFITIWESNILKITMIIMITFLILIDWWGLSMFGSKIDFERFGTVGNWFSNLATLMAVVFAAITIRNDKLIAEETRSLTIKLKEDEQTRKELEQQQQTEILSKAIYVWCEGTQDIITERMCNFSLSFSNKTNAPIFEWVVNSQHDKLADSELFGPIFPGLRSIKITNLNGNENLSIEFVSFLGKRYKRFGVNVQEV